MSPQCVRSCEGFPSCPRKRRRAWRIHAVRPTGPRLSSSPRASNVVGSSAAGGRSPGFFVACCLRRRSRPLPRHPVKDDAFPARRTFHRRVLFPRRSAFRQAPPRASSRSPEEPERFRGWPSSALPTVVSPAAFAFAALVIPHVGDGRSRSPFTRRGNRSFPCALLWIRRSPAFSQLLLREAG